MLGLIRSKAEQLGVPPGALTVGVTEPVQQLTNVNQYMRPIPGGVQITRRTWGTTDICTMAFNAYSAYGFGFVTNSHCSETYGAVDTALYMQATWTDQTPEVGGEAIDPPYWTGGSCPAGKYCRNSCQRRVKIGHFWRAKI